SLKSAITGDPDWNNRIIVGSVLESLTSGNLQISAGFDVGTDDWEFPNYGSYLTPAGQCVGQSCLAIWYYNYCKKALGSAFHKYDTNLSNNRPDEYWFDNPKAFRFSVVIHRDIEESNRLDGWETLMEKQMSHPGIIWKSVLVQMIIRNSPQLLFLRENATGLAHAVICYKVDLKEKKLYVADPNFPGDATRTIPYTETSIGPYTSRSSASSTRDIVFNQVCYIQISNALDGNEMRLRWSEFENGTIGNDKFPKYKLFAGNIGGTEVTDRMLVNNAEFKVVCKSEDCEAYINGTDRLQKIFIVNSDGVSIGQADFASHGIATCTLQPADNKIGIYVTGLRANGQEYYVDFKWFTINLGEVRLTITPDPLQAIADKPCSFIVEVKGTLPASYKLVWNFGDNTGDISSGTSRLVEHTFTKEGSYDITCTLYDNANSSLVARTTSKATIISTFVSELLDTKYLFVTLNADMRSDEGISLNPITIDMEYKHYNNQKIKWNGMEFSLDFKYELSGTSADPVVVTGSLSGNVSADGKILESLTAIQRKELKSQTGGWREESVELKTVPFSDHTGDATKYQMTGAGIKAVVTDASISWKRQNPISGEWETFEMRYLDFDNTALIPTLRVDFYKY
ncbi:MAG: PKD domain-containing protein, partial [Bacteroidales bacterium]